MGRKPPGQRQTTVNKVNENKEICKQGNEEARQTLPIRFAPASVVDVSEASGTINPKLREPRAGYANAKPTGFSLFGTIRRTLCKYLNSAKRFHFVDGWRETWPTLFG